MMNRTRFARLITMKVKKGRSRRFVEAFRSEVASTAGTIDGLRRLYLLRPADEADEFVALSLWDDEKSANNYVRSGKNDTYSAKLTSLLKESEKVRKFKVELHIVGEGAKERAPHFPGRGL